MQTHEELIKIILLQQNEIQSQQIKIQSQESKILELTKIIQELKREIAELREKLNTNSNNSSTSPSQDPNREKKPRKGTGRKPGGQPGHRGYSRKLFPPEEVQSYVDVYPEGCPNCRTDAFLSDPIQTYIHQQVELPKIKPEVTEYHFHTCQCDKCGKQIFPQIPPEAKKGFGPRLMGFIEMLTGEGRATKRVIVKILGVMGIPISSGSVSNIHQLAGEILKDPYDIIKAEVLNQNMNADETSWYTNGQHKWFWIGATRATTFFQIDSSRSMEACKRIFGNFKKILTTDRYGAYNVLECNKQSCWSHLDRDFTKIEGRGEIDEVIGKALKAIADQVFKIWKEFCRGYLTRKELQNTFESDIIPSMKSTLKVAVAAEGVTAKTQATCLNILMRFETLFTFIYHEGVEPTNNLAERNLRPGVIWRKLTAGSRSEWGEKHIERLLTVTTTLRQRAKNVFEYLVSCFTAWQRDGPMPNPL
jgi:transposase